ncbi:hypothetical protein C0992_001968 [Termitomyces sp. T32_za158]|nr:hypothetical protein C0992_001968 [Termitomyces sp. T32_za158]
MIELIKNASPNGGEMLLNGKAPLPGQVVKLPNLAQTFRELAIKGKDGFYKGRIAQAIVDVIQSKGGVMELADLAKHSTTFVEPISYTYGDVTVHERIGNLLRGVDSQWYVADPEMEHVPVAQLLSKPLGFGTGGNVHNSFAEGLVLSQKAAVPKGCGFTLQNRGCGFVLNEKHPNALRGGKRPYHTIIPALATRGDEIFLSYGVMGGYMQPQGHVQVLLNILRGYTVQDALDAPRFCISSGMPDAGSKAGNPNSEVYIEEGIPSETVAKLRGEWQKNQNQASLTTSAEMGHDVRVVTGYARGMFGRGQVIQKLNDTSGRLVWAAGSDMRADGHAAPQI